MKRYFTLKPLDFYKEKLVLELKQLYNKAFNHLQLSVIIISASFLLPLFCIGFSYFKSYQELNHLENRIAILEKKAKKTFLGRSREATFMRQAEVAEKEFIQKHLKLDNLLKKEEQEVQNLLAVEALKESSFLLERHRFLAENKGFFIKNPFYDKGSLQEIVYRLEKPIEMQKEDVQNLLQVVEGDRLASLRPQIFFEHFLLKKKAITSEYFVFEVDCSLIERSLK